MIDSLKRFLLGWNKDLRIIQGVILLAYVLLRVITTLSAIDSPRELADTDIYLRISKEQILGSGFLEVRRPFVFPLLLQILGGAYETTAVVQLALSIIAWVFMGIMVSGTFHRTWLRLFSLSVVLGLSLVRHLAGWDFVMMTESLSLTAFVLLIAVGIWNSREWHVWKTLILFSVAFLFAFSRDTNAYLLLMVAGLLGLSVLFRWSSPRLLVPAGLFLLIFLVSDLSANASERWVFPFLNVMGKRVLPYSASVEFFKSCGMPVTPQLLDLADTFANGQDKAFFSDPALEGFRQWVGTQGKPCYMRWLVFNPVDRTAEALAQFNDLIYFEKVNWYFSRRFTDLLPSRLERALYPVYSVQWVWISLTFGALVAVFKKAWRSNSLWAIFILMSLTIFPHLFITWHGDAMAPERHAISVGLQLSLSLWLFVFLLLETVQFHMIGDREI